MGPLPKSNNFDYLLVVIDRLTSQVHLMPTMMMVTTRGVTWLILKEVMRLHGIPESIVSDRDTKFTSIFWKELHRLMGSKLLMSTVFHPQTDGATERANRSIAQILRTIVSNNQKDWLGKCLMVQFAINSSVNATTGYTPFELNHGYMPLSGQHISTNTVRGQPSVSHFFYVIFPFPFSCLSSPSPSPPYFLAPLFFMPAMPPPFFSIIRLSLPCAPLVV